MLNFIGPSFKMYITQCLFVNIVYQNDLISKFNSFVNFLFVKITYTIKNKWSRYTIYDKQLKSRVAA